MSENNYCPCCGRHCSLDTPRCPRGEAYVRTGEITKREGRVQDCVENREISTEKYSTLDMDNKLIMNLRDLGHQIRFLFEGKGSQKRILIILHENGGMTQRELTERIGIQPGSASEVIKKLESAGLIQRQNSSSDRRTVDITLTPEGRIQAEEAAAQRKQRHQEMFSCLSEEEKKSLLELSEKLNADWAVRYRDAGKEHRHHGPEGHHSPMEHHGPEGHHGSMEHHGPEGRHGGRGFHRH